MRMRLHDMSSASHMTQQEADWEMALYTQPVKGRKRSPSFSIEAGCCQNCSRHTSLGGTCEGQSTACGYYQENC